MWHDSFILESHVRFSSMCHICLMTDFFIHVLHMTHSLVSHMTHSYVSHMTHSYVSHMTHSYVSHMTHSLVSHMTHSYVSHMTHSYVSDMTHSSSYVTRASQLPRVMSRMKAVPIWIQTENVKTYVKRRFLKNCHGNSHTKCVTICDNWWRLWRLQMVTLWNLWPRSQRSECFLVFLQNTGY